MGPVNVTAPTAAAAMNMLAARAGGARWEPPAAPVWAMAVSALRAARRWALEPVREDAALHRRPEGQRDRQRQEDGLHQLVDGRELGAKKKFIFFCRSK